MLCLHCTKVNFTTFIGKNVQRKNVESRYYNDYNIGKSSTNSILTKPFFLH